MDRTPASETVPEVAPVRGLAAYLGATATSLPRVLIATLAAVSIVLSSCLAYPSIIFADQLAPYYRVGLGQSLIGAAILGIVLALTSSFRGTVAQVQSQAVVVIAIMAQTIGATMTTTPLDDRTASTLIMLVSLSTLLAGAFLTTLGFFRLGNLVRYIPFPVVGGFLAAIGWLLVESSFSATLGRAVSIETLSSLVDLENLARCLPGVCLGALLWHVQRKRFHWLNAPLILLGSVAVFWVLALAAGKSFQELQSSGWLIGPLPEGTLWSPARQLEAWSLAEWSSFPAQLPKFFTLACLSAVSVLLAASSVELAVRQDMDLNRELRVTGVGNLLAGLVGGLPAYGAASTSILSYKMQVPVRLVGLCVASACLLTLTLGASAIAMVPRLTVSLILFATGLGFLFDWLYRGFFRLSLADYGILLSVFLTVVLVGFMEGIALGVIFGLLIFAIRYSRVGVARRISSGAVLHSNVERSEELKATLREHGDGIEIITLQGFLFFGTANRLVDMVRTRIIDSHRSPLAYLVLDFSLVNGLDASAVVGFKRILQYAEQFRFRLLLANLSEQDRFMFRREEIDERIDPRVFVFSDLDRALEWCENDILEVRRLYPAEQGISIEAKLQEIFEEPGDAEEFRRVLEPVDFVQDDVLIEQGAESDDLFVIESGQVMIALRLPDGSEIRVRAMDAGTIVGEVAFYLGVPRSASVVGTRAGRAYRLSRTALAGLAIERPRAATGFHAYMARTMADKLVDTTRLLSVLKT